MKVKFSESSITFKIAQNELQQLLSGSTLAQVLSIGGTRFSMSIEPLPMPSVESRLPPIQFTVDSKESGIVIFPSQEQLQHLADMGRDRQGLILGHQGLDVILQVDLRGDRRSRTQLSKAHLS